MFSLNNKAKVLMFASLSVGSTVVSTRIFAQGNCGSVFGSENTGRSASTHTMSGATNVKTSPARETEIARLEKNMLDEIYARGKFKGASPETPPMELVPEEGVKASYTDRYDGGHPEITHIKVSGIGPSGILKATMVLPVSGHTGVANAEAWAKTDTYTLLIGTKAIVKNVKSLDLVTKHEVEIPLKIGSNEVFYERSGSGGVGGYPEGRTIVVEWDGN